MKCTRRKQKRNYRKYDKSHENKSQEKLRNGVLKWSDCKMSEETLTDAKPTNDEDLSLQKQEEVNCDDSKAINEEIPSSDESDKDEEEKAEDDKKEESVNVDIIVKELTDEVNNLSDINKELKKKVTMFQQLFRNEEKLFKVAALMQEQDRANATKSVVNDTNTIGKLKVN